MPMPPDADPAAPTPAEEPAPAPDAAPAGSTSWRRFLPRRRAAAGEESGGEAPAEGATEAIPVPGRERAGALHRRRRALIAQRQEAVYHLGGLAFELYRRDLLGEEVMRRRAGEIALLDDTVRDIDTRLSEMDRERRERRDRSGGDPPAGNCLRCHAPFRAEARFCWQCGARVVPESEGDEQVTATIAPPP